MEEFARFELEEIDIIANICGDLIENYNRRYDRNLDEYYLSSAVVGFSDLLEDRDSEEVIFVDDDMEVVIFASYSKEGREAIFNIRSLMPTNRLFINKGGYRTNLKELIKADFPEKL